MSDQDYVQKRLSSLQAELTHIDETLPRLTSQVNSLTSRRLLLQGAFLELQDFVKQTPAENGSKVLTPEVVSLEA